MMIGDYAAPDEVIGTRCAERPSACDEARMRGRETVRRRSRIKVSGRSPADPAGVQAAGPRARHKPRPDRDGSDLARWPRTRRARQARSVATGRGQRAGGAPRRIRLRRYRFGFREQLRARQASAAASGPDGLPTWAHRPSTMTSLTQQPVRAGRRAEVLRNRRHGGLRAAFDGGRRCSATATRA
jgi:hypothetical protein